MSSGVIRRIDDLGRVVIPKEFRKSLRIFDGDSFEIFVSDDCLIMKKFSPILSLGDMCQKYIDSFNKVINKNILICDKDNFIAVSGNLKNKYYNKNISSFVTELQNRRDICIENRKVDLSVSEEGTEYCSYVLSDIISNCEIMGSVIIISHNSIVNDLDIKMAIVISNLISENI